MEELRSRQNSVIRYFRALARDGAMRAGEGLFLCDGRKLLEEALRSRAGIQCVLWKENRDEQVPGFREEYVLPGDLFEYVSPMNHSPGPLFTVSIPKQKNFSKARRVLLLEEMQDPGNVGTVLRTADAFGIDGVILLEGCADPWAPKTARASMGAIFRQPILKTARDEAVSLIRELNLPLYGAALSPRAESIQKTDLQLAAVAIGSEGHGLSSELLAACDGELIIPMPGGAESLNAAVASAIVMWEMSRREA